ncbi:MAG: 3-oxoadipate enol-lactonase [Mycobacterium sp.]|jgi:3-oxoadipate enol-lactonase|nr:catD2 [Mycobacterium sp.]MDT5130920.1 3-oxoadipate enol-lactonase [Mycobacterium sp.]
MTFTQADWDNIKATARKSIRIDGEDLPYLDLGPRDAPNLVFTNGALLTMDFWKYQAPVFAQHFRTIVYDYRESGPRANNADGFTADLADIIEQLDLAPVTIIASSMGGLFTARYAADHPDRLNGMVICSSFPRFPQRLMINVGLVGSYVVPTSFLAGRSRVLVCGDRDRELGDLFMRTVSAMPRRTVRNRYLILRNTRNHDVLPRIKGVPTLIMSGTLDEDVPVEHGKYLADHIDGAEFKLLEGGGHLGYFEQHDRFNTIALDWLRTKGLLPSRTG